MIRLLILVLVLSATPTFAGFKMFGPNGYMNSSETEEERAARQTKEAVAQQILLEQRQGAPAIKSEPRDNFDLSGVEWRQSRGHYSGRATKEMTRKFGYRAGKYRLEYEYKARRYFGIWMHTRRGLNKLLVNRVGRADTHVDVILPKDDEVWFEVESPFGNWEFTFERVGY